MTQKMSLTSIVFLCTAVAFILLVSLLRPLSLGPALQSSYDLQTHPGSYGDSLLSLLFSSLGMTGVRIFLLLVTLATLGVFYAVGRSSQVDPDILSVMVIAFALSPWRLAQSLSLDTVRVLLPIMIGCSWLLLHEGRRKIYGMILLILVFLLSYEAGIACCAVVLGLIWFQKKSIIRWGIGFLLLLLFFASIRQFPSFISLILHRLPIVDLGDEIGFSAFGLLLGIIGLGFRSSRLFILAIIGLGMGFIVPSLWYIVDGLLAFGLAQFFLVLRQRSWQYPDVGHVVITLFMCSVLFSSLVASQHLRYTFPNAHDVVQANTVLPYISPLGNLYVVPRAMRSYLEVTTPAPIVFPSVGEDELVLSSRNIEQVESVFSSHQVSTIIELRDPPGSDQYADLAFVLGNPERFTLVKDGSSIRVWLYRSDKS